MEPPARGALETTSPRIPGYPPQRQNALKEARLLRRVDEQLRRVQKHDRMAQPYLGEQRCEEHRLMLAVRELIERETLSGSPREREPGRRVRGVQAEEPEMGSEVGNRSFHGSEESGRAARRATPRCSMISPSSARLPRALSVSQARSGAYLPGSRAGRWRPSACSEIGGAAARPGVATRRREGTYSTFPWVASRKYWLRSRASFRPAPRAQRDHRAPSRSARCSPLAHRASAPRA